MFRLMTTYAPEVTLLGRKAVPNRFCVSAQRIGSCTAARSSRSQMYKQFMHALHITTMARHSKGSLQAWPWEDL